MILCVQGSQPASAQFLQNVWTASGVSGQDGLGHSGRRYGHRQRDSNCITCSQPILRACLRFKTLFVHTNNYTNVCSPQLEIMPCWSI